MRRFFTLAEATALLPEVERRLQEAQMATLARAHAEEQLTQERERILYSGGAAVDRKRVTRLAAEREAFRTIAEQEMEELRSLGVEVKDMEEGLVDFPTYYHLEEVLLCWKLGEQAIEYWHGLEEGFRGRKRIDPGFISANSGGPRS
jgi:hypothetical protein